MRIHSGWINTGQQSCWIWKLFQVGRRGGSTLDDGRAKTQVPSPWAVLDLYSFMTGSLCSFSSVSLLLALWNALFEKLYSWPHWTKEWGACPYKGLRKECASVNDDNNIGIIRDAGWTWIGKEVKPSVRENRCSWVCPLLPVCLLGGCHRSHRHSGHHRDSQQASVPWVRGRLGTLLLEGIKW